MSIKSQILEYLADGTWRYGGQIDDFIRSVDGAKASNVSRRCRELVNEGRIEVRRVQVDGSGPHVVQYKIRPKIELPPTYKEPIFSKKQEQELRFGF